MAKVHDAITPALQQFIAAQFFVATASLAAHGHVNPYLKGLQLQSRRLFHCNSLDVTGSGNEAAAPLVLHL